MKPSNYLLTLVAVTISVMLSSCSVREELNEPETLAPEEVFTLTATKGDPQTRLTLDEDGFGTSWEPGDKLYLVDTKGKISTVEMTTAITERAKSASFTSKTSVLPGQYIVLYGSSSQSVSVSLGMTSLLGLNNRILLYGALTVDEGQTSASISLKHVYSRLTFKMRNVPTGMNDINCGMAIANSGIPVYSSTNSYDNTLTKNTANGSIECDGYKPYLGNAVQKLSLGWMNTSGTLLIPPMDLSGKKIYFYVYGTDSNGRHITYEFVKSGINLREGVNYNITFDFSNPSSRSVLEKSALTNGAYSLNTPEQVRAAAFWNSSNSFSLESDIDFTGEDYFPFKASKLHGHKHTLSNISLDMHECDYVGIMSVGTADSLYVESATIKGRDYVGAVSGYYNGSDYSNGCMVKSSSIEARDYVGGLCGFFKGYSINGFKASDITIKGQSNVGGCLGDYEPKSSSYKLLSSQVKESTILGTARYVGGLVGYVDGYSSYTHVQKCGFEGNVISSGSYCGGIAGYMYDGNVEECYVKGNVEGTEKVGGINGSGTARNSYIIGDVTGTSSQYVGGISGNGFSCNYCYSYGTVSSGYGIAYSLYNSSNLSSSAWLSNSSSGSENCNCGPSKTFLSKLSVINVEEKYSSQVWKGIDAQCPLLQWQSELLNGDISAPGFGNEDW